MTFDQAVESNGVPVDGTSLQSYQEATSRIASVSFMWWKDSGGDISFEYTLANGEKIYVDARHALQPGQMSVLWDGHTRRGSLVVGRYTPRSGDEANHIARLTRGTDEIVRCVKPELGEAHWVVRPLLDIEARVSPRAHVVEGFAPNRRLLCDPDRTLDDDGYVVLVRNGKYVAEGLLGGLATSKSDMVVIHKGTTRRGAFEHRAFSAKGHRTIRVVAELQAL